MKRPKYRSWQFGGKGPWVLRVYAGRNLRRWGISTLHDHFWTGSASFAGRTLWIDMGRAAFALTRVRLKWGVW